jgi:hypothetical protein
MVDVRAAFSAVNRYSSAAIFQEKNMASLLVLTVAGWMFAADGKVYKCIGANGMPIYKNTPCERNQKASEVKIRRDPTATTPPPESSANAISVPKGERPAVPDAKLNCRESVMAVKRDFDARHKDVDQQLQSQLASKARNDADWQESQTSKVADTWQPQLIRERELITSELDRIKNLREEMAKNEAAELQAAKKACQK